MNKKIIYSIIAVSILVLALIFIFTSKKDKEEIGTLEALVVNKENGLVTVKDSDNIIYTFEVDDISLSIGDYILLEYAGLIDKNKEKQDVKVISYEVKSASKDINGIPSDYMDDGIFSTYYVMAYNKLKELSKEEKIGQLLLVRYSDNAIEANKKYNFGGFVFFEKDFKNKTKDQVVSMISDLQKSSKIPLLTAVDEEGGKVVRVSSNPNLASEPFKSPKSLYDDGQFSLIRSDTIKKSDLLNSLGLNVNLAPVVDVTTDPDDYMYERALGENTALTSEFASTVIKASKGTGVSYTLKHFPGYGSNKDTHTQSSLDTRSLEDIKTNDLPPFKAGIDAGAEAVLVSHNVVTSVDKDSPASLSKSIHNLLRNELKFTGIIMTDDLDMGATKSIDKKYVKAIQAGNDLIITTDYEKAFNEINTALNDGTLSEDEINKLAFRVLAWKYYKGLMIDVK